MIAATRAMAGLAGALGWSTRWRVYSERGRRFCLDG